MDGDTLVAGLSLYEFRDGLWCEVKTGEPKKGHFAFDPNFDILLWAHADLVTRYFQTLFMPTTLANPEAPHDPPKLAKGLEVTRADVIDQLDDWSSSFRISFRTAGGRKGKSTFEVFRNKMAAYFITIEQLARARFMAAAARKRGEDSKVKIERQREANAREKLQTHARTIHQYLMGMISGDNPNVKTEATNRAGKVVKYPTKKAISNKIADELNGLIAKLVEATISAQRGNYRRFNQWRRDARAHAEDFGRMLNEMVLSRRIR